ncbi:MAG: universal stress protein [Chloroflexi bacterium]|nr:universal stress protein [Chloroflexota bacterium]
MLSTIVVPLDGSGLAERALPYATRLTRQSQGRLLLVRAAWSRRVPGKDETQAEIAATEAAEADLEAAAAKLRADGLEVETHVYYDRPAPAIVDLAMRQGAHLIVMSTHGRGGLGRWIYGSVADEVLRHAPAPVLLIPASCTQTWPTDRPLRLAVPLDGSELAEEALGAVTKLKEALPVEITLIQVVGTSYYAATEFPVVTIDPEGDVAAAQQYLDQIVARLGANGITATANAELGRAPEIIARVARERDCDAIVMATHGHGGLARLVLGSTATGVIHLTNLPLLLVLPESVREAAPVTESGQAVTLTLDQRDLELVRRSLDRLVESGEADAHAAAHARELRARLTANKTPA